MTWRFAAFAVLFSYAIGSIPFGWIVARFRGIDIRQHGSGNIGATNVLRTLGKGWGVAVFCLDALKGFAAVLVVMLLSYSFGANAEFYPILAATFAVVGHSFPIWLGFRGGKGVATSAGALAAIVPWAVAAMLIIWTAVFYASRYVSLASIVAAITLPIAVSVLRWTHRTEGYLLFYFCSALTVLVVWRHRSNIARLLRGTEPRFTR